MKVLSVELREHEPELWGVHLETTEGEVTVGFWIGMGPAQIEARRLGRVHGCRVWRQELVLS